MDWGSARRALIVVLALILIGAVVAASIYEISTLPWLLPVTTEIKSRTIAYFFDVILRVLGILTAGFLTAKLAGCFRIRASNVGAHRRSHCR